MNNLLARFAHRENLLRLTLPKSAGQPLFAHYRNSLPVIDLRAFDRRETIHVSLSEAKSFSRNPSGRFDSLEQKLRNELGAAFGTDVHYETVVTRGDRRSVPSP